MSEQDDDEIVTITARVRVDSDGYYLLRDTAECETLGDFNDQWVDRVGGAEDPYRDAIIEIRMRKPKPAPATEVTVPDAPADPLAEARAV